MEIPEDVIEKIIPNFTKAVEKGNWKKGLDDMIAQLEAYRNSLKNEEEELVRQQ